MLLRLQSTVPAPGGFAGSTGTAFYFSCGEGICRLDRNSLARSYSSDGKSGPASLCCKQGLKADRGVSVDKPVQKTGPTGSTVWTLGTAASNTMMTFAAAFAAFAFARDHLGLDQGRVIKKRQNSCEFGLADTRR